MDLAERIRKLYALSTRNSNTEEAASAAAKIQELCFKHNLELEAILASGAGEKTPYVKFDYMLPETAKADIQWKRTLFGGICKANFCQAVTIPNTSRMAVVGQKHNFEAVGYAYEYLTKEIQRLAIVECIKQGFLTNKDRKKYVVGFCEGAMTTVYRKLNDQFKQQEQSGNDCRALVVVKSEELKKAVFIHYPHLRHTRYRSSGSTDGYSHGRVAGNGISIHRGVGSNNGTRQIA